MYFYVSQKNCDIYFEGIARELHNLATSAKCDSESDFQDQTPDTDDSGAHSYPEVAPTNTFGISGTSSFKRAPVMGNRGLEQRGKKSRTYPPKESPQPVSVLIFIIHLLVCVIDVQRSATTESISILRYLIQLSCSNCCSITNIR